MKCVISRVIRLFVTFSDGNSHGIIHIGVYLTESNLVAQMNELVKYIIEISISESAHRPNQSLFTNDKTVTIVIYTYVTKAKTTTATSSSLW